ncbi:carboxylesterase family protein [Nocardioides sp. dk4132]|uniref:carboxylesterase/lipase family protein n=1 Tax=unclassified Nocardioides TaxID=2615069 RepID=UPI0012970E57|nr:MULTISPECIES: carboxylesterase family protein [unclassified Nocardioides]MQW74521.1 carboxylesterase family protein [Nocardioides sp. dk4132]QGA06447.1 carboxylesterase family protein [Nocardioides sp. dk884]
MRTDRLRIPRAFARHTLHIGLGVGLAAALAVPASALASTAPDEPAVGRAATSTATTDKVYAGATVRTRDGRLRGAVKQNHRVFSGIRYAVPAARWGAPRPQRPWTGTRTALRPGAECAQLAVFWRPGHAASRAEDCLFLNVYTPRRATGKRPVQVFFHGGGGINGAATDAAPVRMADQGDSVVVTVNYRLGVLGGLNLPGLDVETADGRSGGNYANLDKVEALRWVQRNIAAFGGDRRRVTIAGQSAGAGAVCWLLASPSAAGLFSAAVVQSAGSCGNALTREESHAAGLRFAEAAGCPDADTALACLRATSVADLLDAQAATGTGSSTVAGGSDLPLLPKDAFASGRFNRVPVIIGNVRNEGRAFVYEANDMVRQPVTPASYVAQIEKAYGERAAEILAEYPLSDYRTPGVARAKVQTDDRVCTALPVTRSISRFTPTWTYEFRDETAPLRPYMTIPPSYRIGSGHSAELPYLWQSEIVGSLNRAQLRLSGVMIGHWSRLAHTGRPTGRDVGAWPRFRTGSGEQRLLFLAGGRTRVIAGDAFVAEHHCDMWLG